MKSLSSFFKEVHPVCEGIFDKQDEILSIKSLHAPFYKLVDCNGGNWADDANFEQCSFENGYINLDLVHNVVCDLPMPGELEKYYPGLKGIRPIHGALQWRQNEQHRFDIFDEHVIGKDIFCNFLQSHSRVIKNVNINTLSGVNLYNCEELQNVSMVYRGDSRVISFMNVDKLPTFKNCHIIVDHVKFDGQKLLQNSESIFKKLFDFKYDAEFVLKKDGSSIKSPQNFAKLMSYMKYYNKYQVKDYSKAFKINPDFTIKDLGIDIGHMPDVIQITEESIEMIMLKYDNPSAWEKLSRYPWLDDVLPACYSTQTRPLRIQIDQLKQCDNLKTKEEYLVFFRREW